MKKSVGPREKIEVKGGRLVKKLEFGQTKKKFIHQLFKRKSFAFMTYGRFLPKNSSKLRFVIRVSKVQGLRGGATEALEPTVIKVGTKIAYSGYSLM